VGSPLGVDPLAAAEDGDGMQARLGVHPLRPEPAVWLPEAPTDVRQDWQPGFQGLVVEDPGPALLDQHLNFMECQAVSSPLTGPVIGPRAVWAWPGRGGDAGEAPEQAIDVSLTILTLVVREWDLSEHPLDPPSVLPLG
jgi:hypothetical protein